MVDGHLRVELAIARKEPTVPVTDVELSEDEERLILATLEPLAAMANAGKDALASLLAELSPAGTALAALLAELAEEHGLRRPMLGDPDEADVYVEPGSLWRLGEHRLFLWRRNRRVSRRATPRRSARSPAASPESPCQTSPGNC